MVDNILQGELHNQLIVLNVHKGYLEDAFNIARQICPDSNSKAAIKLIEANYRYLENTINELQNTINKMREEAV